MFMGVKRLVISIIVELLALIFIAVPVIAQENIRSGDSVDLPANQVVDRDFFAAGQTVVISGTVNGDAYVAGGTVIVEGIVNGDLLAAGGTVTVRGRVTDDVRVAGGTVTISGTVGGNVSTAAGTVNLTDAARLGESLVGAVGTLEVYAPVAEDVTVAGGQVIIGSTIGGDVVAAVERLILTPQARIAGDLDYWSQVQADIRPGAIVVGETTKHAPPQRVQAQEEEIGRAFAGFALFTTLMNLVSSLVAGLLLIRFYPVFTQGAVSTIARKPLLSLGIGFLTLILTPILIIILMITLLGIPLALVLLALYLVSLFFSSIIVALFIGQLIIKPKDDNMPNGWALLLGLVILAVITTLIPLIGPLINFFVILFGLGALLVAERNMYAATREKNIA